MLLLGGKIKGNITDQTDLKNALDNKQSTLISGENIKTINNESILGNGNITIQGGTTTLKTINNETLEGTGNIDLQVPLVSGTNIKTINNQSILGNGNINIENLINISTTTAQKIGTWIDGKDLYIQAIPFKMPNVTTDGVFPANRDIPLNANIDFCFLLSSYIINDGSTAVQNQSLPYLTNGGNQAKAFTQFFYSGQYWTLVSATNIGVYSNKDCIGILLFTLK